MKVLQPVPVRVLASRIIPSVDPGLVAAFKLEPRHRALALFTSDSDDVSYIAIDEATKKAAVDVVYASSFYGGAAHASGPYSGEPEGRERAYERRTSLSGSSGTEGCYG